jgi:uncharacterized membrane protein
MDDTHFASTPTASYGVILVLTAISYLLLEKSIVACNGPDSKLARAVGEDDTKASLSMVIYVLAIPLAYYRPWLAIVLYILNAMVWFIPDSRIEKLEQKSPSE